MIKTARELKAIYGQINAIRKELDLYARVGLEGTLAWSEAMARYEAALVSQLG